MERDVKGTEFICVKEKWKQFPVVGTWARLPGVFGNRGLQAQTWPPQEPGPRRRWLSVRMFIYDTAKIQTFTPHSSSESYLLSELRSKPSIQRPDIPTVRNAAVFKIQTWNIDASIESASTRTPAAQSWHSAEHDQRLERLIKVWDASREQSSLAWNTPKLTNLRM